MNELLETIERLNQAIDQAEARARMKAAITAALAIIETLLPGFPPMPGFGDWNKTEAELHEQTDTLSFNQCMMWGYAAAAEIE